MTNEKLDELSRELTKALADTITTWSNQSGVKDLEMTVADAHFIVHLALVTCLEGDYVATLRALKVESNPERITKFIQSVAAILRIKLANINPERIQP